MLSVWETVSENVVFLMFLLPLAGAAVVSASARFGAGTIRRTAMTNALLTFFLSILMVAKYDPQLRDDSATPQTVQMVTSVDWVGKEAAGLNVRIAVGVDGISLWLIALSAFLVVPAMLACWDRDQERPAAFYSTLLLLESGLIGTFAARDVIFFYVCLELVGLSLLFLVGRWGGYERRGVLKKFFVFNMAGSLLILIGLTGLVLGGSWPAESNSGVSQWIGLALLIGLWVKTAVVPFHSWLPTINSEAPAAVNVLLIGVVVKIGLYGCVRFLLPFFPALCTQFAGLLSTVAIAGSVYAGLLALAQDDLKKLATYAGISQLGLCMAGVFSLSRLGVTGALLHAIGQGLSLGAVLFVIDALERRYGTRDIEAFGGMAVRYPRLGLLMTIALLSVAAVPGLAGFAGNTLTLMGISGGSAVMEGRALGALGGLVGSLLVTWACLWLLQRTLQGRFREPVFGLLQTPDDAPVRSPAFSKSRASGTAQREVVS